MAIASDSRTTRPPTASATKAGQVILVKSPIESRAAILTTAITLALAYV